jgi:hypothetical protein
VFVDADELEMLRAHWDQRAADFEAGRSVVVAADALWCPGWYPLARSGSELYAYAPLGCFGGPPGQILRFDTEAGELWEGLPSMAFWIGSLEAACERGLEAHAASAARRWAAGRGRLFQAVLPASSDERRAEARFRVVRSYSPQEEMYDGSLFLRHAMRTGRSTEETLRAIAHALDAHVPHCNLQSLAEVRREDIRPLAHSWLRPLLRVHAAKKYVSQLGFGIESRRDALHLWVWPSARGAEPTVSELHGNSVPCLRALSKLLHDPQVGFSSEAWTFARASAAFLIRDLLNEVAAGLPWEGPLEVWLRGESVQLGLFDADGFVPTPSAIARAQLASSRTRDETGLERMGFPGRLPKFIDHPVPERADGARRLQHPDGRVWDVVADASSWQCTMLESDGERHTFTRPIATGWEVETLVAAQLRAGFVEA